jgi:predicted ATP-grasp superfamily ATP-dependent carboligase
MPRVLITDGEGRAPLAACRALRAAGYVVDAVARSRPAATQWSRSCARSLRAPDPTADTAGFAQALTELTSGGEYDVLIPGSDAALLVISEHRDRISCLTGLPEHAAVLRSLNKSSLAEAASEAGAAGPSSALCESPEEAVAAAARLDYPVVVKTPMAVSPNSTGLLQGTSRLARGEAELQAILADFGTRVLVQDRIPGPVYSLAGVRAGGEFLALTCSRYERTWPPEAGNASASQSIAVPDELRRLAGATIDAIGWQGLFEIELVREATGAFVPIDFNPRVYGSLELSNRAGAPLAPIWCDWLLRRPYSRREGQEGCRYRWEDTELRNLVLALRAGRLREAWRIVRPRSGTAHAHFRVSDPAPLLARTVLILRRRLTRGRRKASR